MERLTKVSIEMGPTMQMPDGSYAKAHASIEFDPKKVSLDDAEKALKKLYARVFLIETDFASEVAGCADDIDVVRAVKKILLGNKLTKRKK